MKKLLVCLTACVLLGSAYAQSMVREIVALHRAEVGDLTQFCAPGGLPHMLARGKTPCASGYEPQVAFVAAVWLDEVRATEYGVYINGERLPGSMPVHVGRGGVQMPQWRGVVTLGRDQVWLFAPHATGFDSRYFGPVNRSDAALGLPQYVFPEFVMPHHLR